DGVKNGTETDVDCGGGGCPACDPGKTCSMGTDCTSQICQAGTCTAPVCDDGNTVSGDGCNAGCGVEAGYACSGNMPSTCAPICGDGLVKPGEACDDMNTS